MKDTQYQKYLKQVRRSEIIIFICNFIAGGLLFGLVLFITYYNYFK